MTISFSTWAIRNPTPPILLFLVLTITGMIAFLKLPVNSMPSVVVPVISVKIVQPGASPTEIETQITDKVEKALIKINGIKHLNTTISSGASLTLIEFQFNTNLDRAMEDVRGILASIREQLPQSMQEPQILRIDSDDNAILVYAIEATALSLEELSKFVDNKLSADLLSIKEIAKVTSMGCVNNEIFLNLDPDRLIAYDTTAVEVSRQLAQTNIDLATGRVILAGKEYSLRTTASAKTIELLKETSISIVNNSSNIKTVKLKDLGDIVENNRDDIRSISKLDGRPVVSVSIYRNKGMSEITVAKKVEEKLAQINLKYPNITFRPIFSLAEYTKADFNATIYSFIESFLLTILVVYIFLRDKRATLISALAIPLSIIPSFLFLLWLDFTLNAVSLLAISLVIGVLVDDAIVEIENIHRHMSQGKNAFQSSIIAADEIGLAVIATTLVICAFFLPVSFISGVAGQYFKEFGLTVAIAAFFSLIVARLLTPMLAAYCLKISAINKRNYHSNYNIKFSYWLGSYLKLVNWTLINRRKTVAIACISIILSFCTVPLLKSGFIPHEDYSESNLIVELPYGSVIEQTDNVAQTIMKQLRQHEEVEYVLTTINEVVNQALVKIKLVNPNKRKLTQRQFENKILPDLKKIADVKISFANPLGLKDLTIVLVSDHNELLSQTAIQLEKEMQAIIGLNSITSSTRQKQPEIVIIPDLAKAAQIGINPYSLSEMIRVTVAGEQENYLAKFSYIDRQVPIRVRLTKDKINSLEELNNLKVVGIKGNGVSLNSFANIKFNMGPAIIEHYDRKRKAIITANLNNIAIGDALAQIYNLPTIKTLPKEVALQDFGDIEAMGELFNGFVQAIILGLLMVYAIQVLLYKNWVHPFTRMAALPLSISGVFFMLLLTGNELNMPSLIGILMLMGIADKNSILLVDYIIELIRQGIPKNEAIMEACKVRVRPIVMTSFAMLASMMPIALGLLNNPFKESMAIAVIGGLISSTALSLILVPLIFSYVDDFEE